MKLCEKIKIHYFGHAYNDIYIFIIPILLPVLKNEFGLNYSQAGLMLTGHLGIRSFFSYISGHFGDRYDKRHLLAAGFFLSAVLMAGMFFADSMFSTVIILLFMAVGVSTFHPLATALIGGEVAVETRSFQIGLFEAAGAFGIILASLTSGLIIETWGWRLTCLLFAIPGLPLAWSYLKMKKEKINPTAVADRRVDRFHILTFIIARGIRIFGLGVVISFLPTYGSDHLKLSAGIASWLLIFFFSGSIAGCLLGGRFSDKNDPLLFIWTSTFLLALSILIVTFTTNFLLLYILIILTGFMDGGFYASQNSWLTSVSTAANRGKIHGIAFLIDGLAVTAGPLLFGLLADNIGLVSSFRFMALPIGISFAFFLRLYIGQQSDCLAPEKSSRPGI